MSRFGDFLGTVLGKFQLGIGGPQVKGSGGLVQIRNAADSTYADIEAALFATYGDDFELNAGAAGSGDDWKMTLRRPSTGMTHDLIFVMPEGDPAVGQVLSVASFVGDVITLEYTTIGSGVGSVNIDTTTLAFGDSSPVAMFTKPAGALVEKIQVIIDTPFDGTPTVSIGIAGTVSKYMAATHNDLTASAATVFEVVPGIDETVGTEAIIATYSSGGATVGSARILVTYVDPA